MNARWSLTLVLILGAALAGCLGGDDAKVSTNDDDIEPDEGTGSITGRVLTSDLSEIEGATVALVDDGELVGETRSDETGKYTLESIEPGQYRLQVGATCCREAVQGVEVVEGETITVDMQLDRFTAADLKQPFIEEFDWTGFLACGAGAVGVTTNPCFADESSDNVHDFEVDEGINALAFGMTWDSAGGVFGEDLYVTLENDGCDATECSYEYGQLEGSDPLSMVVNNGDISDDEWKWDKVEGKRPLQFRVFPSFEVAVVYQQAFTVHWHVFHNQEAPGDYTPIPDA